MEKIQDVCTQSITIEKAQKSSGSKYYRISITKKGNGFDARYTLKIANLGQNPRIEACAPTVDEAVTKLLTKIFNALKQAISSNLANYETLFKIFDTLSISIKDLKLDNSPVMTYFYAIMANCYSLLNNDSVSSIGNNTFFTHTTCNKAKQNLNTVLEEKSFVEVAREWFKYKYQFTIKTADNPNPLSRKTLDGYNKTMNLVLIPFFKDNEKIDSLTDENFKSCIDNTNGATYKENVYIVLNMILNFAREKRYLSYIRTVNKPVKPQQKSVLRIEGHDFNYIESDRHNHWIKCFQDDETDIALLFETMLLAGLRPEEACAVSWDWFNFDSNIIVVRNAFKDFAVYNDDYEVIGHCREFDTLKSEDSYRIIPLHPTLKNDLLKHKDEQKSLFKKYKMKWSEKSPVFLNRYRRPYVSENLSHAMKSFRSRFNLEYLTPYGLRHSFATFLSENGVQDIVLMRVMGHADFKTTQKYYIFVSNKRKQEQLQKAWQALEEAPPYENISPIRASDKELESVQNVWENKKSA